MIGLACHLFYVFVFCLYIQVAYIYEHDKQVSIFVLLATATVHPIVYESQQIWRYRLRYLYDPQNYVD